MKKKIVKVFTKKIQKVIGKGSHQLHEPLFTGKEKKYLQHTINQNFVSTAGQYVNEFEKKIKKFTKAKYAIAVVNGTQAIHIALQVCGIKKNCQFYSRTK